MEKTKNNRSESIDVLIVGGGVAGIAAAVSAAAAGANCILLERFGTLGGNVTQANVHSFCGLFEYPVGTKLTFANPGFAPWFADGFRRSGGATAAEVHGRVGVMPTYPALFPGYANRITGSFRSLRTVLNANLITLDMESANGGGSARASYVDRDGAHGITAKIVIDATGDAAAAAVAGLKLRLPTSEELQHATLIFCVNGANEGDLVGYSRLRLSAAIARGSRKGDLPPECDSILVRPGMRQGEAYVSLNLPKPVERPFAPLDRDFMDWYRELSLELGKTLVAFLRDNIPGWGSCRLASWPARVGIREGGRVEGRYSMTEDDILSGARFPDAVARSTWPIELWNARSGATFSYPESSCDISLSALISATNPCLGMAGRCMSGSHEALGALRVLGTSLATGEAIGLSASIAADQGVTLTDVTSDEVRRLRIELIGKEFPQP